MIQSFRDRRLRDLFRRGSRRGIGAREVEKIELILHQLHRATSIDDLRLPGFRLHELSGDRVGTWSIRVTRNWRITFRFEDGDVYDVDYEDYQAARGAEPMSLENPPHPGLSLRYFCIEPCGLTVAEAAAHMQVDVAELAAVCEARAPITADLAVRIDMAFGGNPTVWLQLQADHDLANARKRAESFQIERLNAVELDVAVGD